MSGVVKGCVRSIEPNDDAIERTSRVAWLSNNGIGLYAGLPAKARSRKREWPALSFRAGRFESNPNKALTLDSRPGGTA